ncbi:MAG TPA: DUF6529 family protein [Actinomycetota bacterium]|nr:DUF6529 family protein [Actinomycetota bacterium]
MDDLIEELTRGHVTEVKIVLTSIVAALAVYQVLLMTVGYGKVRLPFLKPPAASFAHRASGDMIVTLTMLVGLMCLGYFGIEDGIEHARPGQRDVVALHVVLGFLLAGAIVFKVIVVRWWHAMGRFLPLIGISVLLLFLLTWWTSAGVYL